MILFEDIYDKMLDKLKGKGGFVLDGEAKEKLKNTLWKDGHLNAKIVAQSPSFIAKEAGFDIPEGTQFFIAPEIGIGSDYPFSGEKLSVTMALYRAKVSLLLMNNIITSMIFFLPHLFYVLISSTVLPTYIIGSG